MGMIRYQHCSMVFYPVFVLLFRSEMLRLPSLRYPIPSLLFASLRQRKAQDGDDPVPTLLYGFLSGICVVVLLLRPPPAPGGAPRLLPHKAIERSPSCRTQNISRARGGKAPAALTVCCSFAPPAQPCASLRASRAPLVGTLARWLWF